MSGEDAPEVPQVETGLSTERAEELRKQYGYNEIAEKEEGLLGKLLRHLSEPMSITIEIAAVLSFIVGRLDDFSLIVALLIVNISITFWQEKSSGDAVRALMKKLAPTARVLRDGRWSTLEARALVPGDLVRVRMGDISPADCVLKGGGYLSMDESTLTGESLPVSKKAGDSIYSGSVVRQGEMNGLVGATGSRTYFGRTAELTGSAVKDSGLERITSRIVYFLVGFAVVLNAVIFVHGMLYGTGIIENLLFVLIMLVASIPIALPVVLSVTMGIGALDLAGKNAIVTRFSSIEELSVMDVLCSDKTGTLTQNQIYTDTPQAFGGHSASDVLLYAALASRRDDMDAIDQAIFRTLDSSPATIPDDCRTLEFIPFDPSRKRTEAKLEIRGSPVSVCKGEPDTLLTIVGDTGLTREVHGLVAGLAGRGYRVIAVAARFGNGRWELIGLIPLFDPLRKDSRETVRAAMELGIKVKMITGDNTAIAGEIGKQLGLEGEPVPANELKSMLEEGRGDIIEHASIFAEVFPESKFGIVKSLHGKGHTVGMTGDGVNDAPALKEAQVGIAVSGATDVAKSAADLVLTAPGLSVIIDAVREGRQVFQKMLSYILYRITETVRILIFITSAILLYGFYPISAFMLVMLALLNDLPIISVSTDRVLAGKSPQKWDMKYIAGLSSALGVLGAAETLLLLYIVMHYTSLGTEAVLSLVFLKLIASGHLTMFVTRNRSPFWRNLPSMPLLLALVSTMAAGFLLVVFGAGVAPVGALPAGLVMAYSVAWFVAEDMLRLLYDRLSGHARPVSGTGTHASRTQGA